MSARHSLPVGLHNKNGEAEYNWAWNSTCMSIFIFNSGFFLEESIIMWVSVCTQGPQRLVLGRSWLHFFGFSRQVAPVSTAPNHRTQLWLLFWSPCRGRVVELFISPSSHIMVNYWNEMLKGQVSRSCCYIPSEAVWNGISSSHLSQWGFQQYVSKVRISPSGLV